MVLNLNKTWFEIRQQVLWNIHWKPLGGSMSLCMPTFLGPIRVLSIGYLNSGFHGFDVRKGFRRNLHFAVGLHSMNMWSRELMKSSFSISLVYVCIVVQKHWKMKPWTSKLFVPPLHEILHGIQTSRTVTQNSICPSYRFCLPKAGDEKPLRWESFTNRLGQIWDMPDKGCLSLGCGAIGFSTIHPLPGRVR